MEDVRSLIDGAEREATRMKHEGELRVARELLDMRTLDEFLYTPLAVVGFGFGGRHGGRAQDGAEYGSVSTEVATGAPTGAPSGAPTSAPSWAPTSEGISSAPSWAPTGEGTSSAPSWAPTGEGPYPARRPAPNTAPSPPKPAAPAAAPAAAPKTALASRGSRFERIDEANAEVEALKRRREHAARQDELLEALVMKASAEASLASSWADPSLASSWADASLASSPTVKAASSPVGPLEPARSAPRQAPRCVGVPVAHPPGVSVASTSPLRHRATPQPMSPPHVSMPTPVGHSPLAYAAPLDEELRRLRGRQSFAGWNR